MPNLQGANPFGQGKGDRSYAARATRTSRPGLAMSWGKGVLRAGRCNGVAGRPGVGRSGAGRRPSAARVGD